MTFEMKDVTPIKSDAPRISFSDDAIAGGCAGAIARILTAPFDVLKIRFQLQGSGSDRKYKTMLQSFKTVASEEGIFALWKGNLSATYLWVSYMAIQFSVYGTLKRFGEQTPNPFLSKRSLDDRTPLTPSEERISKMWKGCLLFLAGAGAGILFCGF